MVSAGGERAGAHLRMGIDAGGRLRFGGGIFPVWFPGWVSCVCAAVGLVLEHFWSRGDLFVGAAQFFHGFLLSQENFSV